MSFEIFASPVKGRTAVDLSKVVAVVDVSNEKGEANTLLKLENKDELLLGTKFKTVMKKFGADDVEEE